MLPHAVASRSSDRCSHIWSEGSDGIACSRVPSSMSWRVARISSSRVTGPPQPRNHRLAIRPRPTRPRSGPSVTDRGAVEPGHGQDPGHAGAQERLGGAAQVVATEVALDRPETDPLRPGEEPRPSRAGEDRAVERRRRQLLGAIRPTVGPGRGWRWSTPTGDLRPSERAHRLRRPGVPRGVRRRIRPATSSSGRPAG